nr:MAG TPA: hypothetical protein [Caudoviricetes sp.]
MIHTYTKNRGSSRSRTPQKIFRFFSMCNYTMLILQNRQIFFEEKQKYLQ